MSLSSNIKQLIVLAGKSFKNDQPAQTYVTGKDLNVSSYLVSDQAHTTAADIRVLESTTLNEWDDNTGSDQAITALDYKIVGTTGKIALTADGSNDNNLNFIRTNNTGNDIFFSRSGSSSISLDGVMNGESIFSLPAAKSIKNYVTLAYPAQEVLTPDGDVTLSLVATILPQKSNGSLKIKAQRLALDNYTIKDANGKYVPFEDAGSDVHGPAEQLLSFYENDEFIRDWILPEGWSVVKAFTLTQLEVAANKEFPDIVINLVLNGTNDFDFNDNLNSTRFVYPTESKNVQNFYLAIPFSKGTHFRSAVDIGSGSTLAPGTIIKAGTSFSAATSPINFGQVIIKNGFEFKTGSELSEVYMTGGQTDLKPGQVLPFGLVVGAGSSIEETFDAEGVVLPPGYQLESEIKIGAPMYLEAAMTVAERSLLKAGTILGEGSTTFKGVVPLNSVTIGSAQGTTMTQDFTLTSSLRVENDKDLAVRTFLPRGTHFPTGMVITGGNYLPGNVSQNTHSNLLLPGGTELKAGTVFGTGARLMGPINFGGGTVLPVGSTLPSGSILPTNSYLGKGMLFEQPTALPQGTVIPGGSTLTSGTVFGRGLTLPTNFNVFTHLRASNEITAAMAVYNVSNEDWLVFGPNTIFGPGFGFSAGTVFGDADTSLDNSYNATTFPLGANITIDAAEYAYVAGGVPSEESCTFTVGTPISTDIFPLTAYRPGVNVFIRKADYQLRYGAGVILGGNFTLTSDALLADAFSTINGRLTHPANKPVNFSTVLKTPMTLSSLLRTTAEIKLPQLPEDVYHENVIPASSVFEGPYHSFSFQAAIILMYNHVVGNMAYGTNKSPVSMASADFGSAPGKGFYPISASVELSQGQYLPSGCQVTLQAPLSFKIGIEVREKMNTENHTIHLPPGTIFPKGENLPGRLVFNGGVEIPAGITLDDTYLTLAKDVVVDPEDSNTMSIAARSTIAAGSFFTANSEMVDGAILGPGSTMGPIVSTITEFGLPSGYVIKGPMTIHHSGTTFVVTTPDDDSDLKRQIAELSEIVNSLVAR